MENKGVLLDVVKVRTELNHVLILEFENGEERQFDMLPYLEQKPFACLKGSPLFSKAFIAHGTVVWPGNIDIAPDTLYSRSLLLHA
jgi:hypothetical protein